MRLVVQRAVQASVRVDGRIIGSLPRPGLVIFVGVTHVDTPLDADRLAAKTWGLRIFDGEQSCRDTDAPLLVVSQFTLYGDARRGNRPSWSAAAPGPISEPLIAHFVHALEELGATVETGSFGADMQVELVNDGPVTLVLDSDMWNTPRRASHTPSQ